MAHIRSCRRTARREAACGPHPIGIAIVQPPAEPGTSRSSSATGAVCNLRIAGRSRRPFRFPERRSGQPTASSGACVARRARRAACIRALALAAVAAATGARDIALRVANVNAATLTIDDRTCRSTARANLLLRYRGKKRTFPYVSAADVLTRPDPRRGAARQDRVRRHDRARHARGGGDAARYAVRGRGSAGHGRRQPPRSRTSSAAPSIAPILEGFIVLAVRHRGRGAGRQSRRPRPG